MKFRWLIISFTCLMLASCVSDEQTNSDNTTQSKVCYEVAKYVELPFPLSVTDVWFLDDETVNISGWMHPDPYEQIYSRQSKVDLVTGSFEFLETAYETKYTIPCENCSYRVFEESPDSSWQLIQVNEGEDKGIWLSSGEKNYRIVDYIPYSSSWKWSKDNTALWFTFTHIESGTEKGVIQLEPSFQMNLNIDQSMPAIPAIGYDSAFSPSDKLLLRTSSGGGQLSRNDNVIYVFDLSRSLTQISATKIVSGVERVEWDESLNDFLLIKIVDQTIQIEVQKENVEYILPASLIEPLLGPIPSSEARLSYPLFPAYSISPSKDYLIVAADGPPPTVILFKCE